MRYFPYKLLCASRSETHFIVSMNGFAEDGIPVTNCSLEGFGTFCRNATLENYLHLQVQYSKYSYLTWEKCLPFRKGANAVAKFCNESSVHSDLMTVEPLQPATEQPSVRPKRGGSFPWIFSTLTSVMNFVLFTYIFFSQIMARVV